MRYLYIFLTVIGFVYFFFKKRKFDFFSIGFFSTFAYCYPALLGFRLDNDTYYPISDKVYACFFIQEFMLIAFAIIFDLFVGKKREFTYSEIYNSRSQEKNYYNLSALFAALFGLVLMVLSIRHYGSLFASTFMKNELLSNTNRIVEYFKYISLFVFIYGFTNRGKFILPIRILSLLFIAYTFLLGHRSFAVLGLLAVVLFYFSKENKGNRLISTVLKHKLVTLIILVSLLFFMFVKNVFSAAMNGNWTLVMERLSSRDYYIYCIMDSEASIIIRNMELVFSNNLQYDIGSHILMYFSLIPFVGGTITSSLGITSFETTFNIAFNPGLSEGYGMGSTYLGEAYAIGGYIFVIYYMILTYIFITFLNCRYQIVKSPFGMTFLEIACVYFTFYLFRNDLIFLLQMLRAQVYILLILFVFKTFIKQRLSFGYSTSSVRGNYYGNKNFSE